jgi:hypothetical protein
MLTIILRVVVEMTLFKYLRKEKDVMSNDRRQRIPLNQILFVSTPLQNFS